MHFKLIIFDFDGTLGDTRRNIVVTMQQTLEAQGLPRKDGNSCASTIGLPLAGCFRSLLPDASDEVIGRCVESYHRQFEINKDLMPPQMFPHVAETLERMTKKGIRMSVATSRGVESLRDLLTSMGIIKYFDLLLGADSVSRHKPDPEPVLMTLEKLNINATDTLVVGDMPVDILMGKGAGCTTCGVTYGNATREELVESGADFIIDDFSALLMLFP